MFKVSKMSYATDYPCTGLHFHKYSRFCYAHHMVGLKAMNMVFGPSAFFSCENPFSIVFICLVIIMVVSFKKTGQQFTGD